MRALEVNAQYFGISLLQLMENAGRSIAQETITRFQKNKKAAVFCGLGGNGGDGFVAARHLLAEDFDVTCGFSWQEVATLPMKPHGSTGAFFNHFRAKSPCLK